MNLLTETASPVWSVARRTHRGPAKAKPLLTGGAAQPLKEAWTPTTPPAWVNWSSPKGGSAQPVRGDRASARWTAGSHCLAVSSRKTHAHYRRAVPEPATVSCAYRIRAYPNAVQRAVPWRLFGATRYVWNWALAKRTDAYRGDGTKLNWVSLSRGFTALRRAHETACLAELPREPFNQVIRDQERAFASFFAKRARYPRFRRRCRHASVRFTLDQRRSKLSAATAAGRAWTCRVLEGSSYAGRGRWSGARAA